MTDKTTPLYVVCSPGRCVGKTLVSRLLTEFYVLDDRPVAAYDLADEGPQLADYLPQFTTVADIGDIFGQMAFFERLIAANDGANIIDLSHRMFQNFFTVVEEIGFFEEARRRSIEPLILFIIDPDPKSPKAYASLRRRFTESSLLPVRNRTEPSAIPDGDAPPDAPPASLEIPLLGFSLRALIDRQAFSFCEFWRARPADLPNALDDELRDWVEGIFFQFRKLEVMLGCVDAATLAAPASRRPRTTHRPLPFPPPPAGEAQPPGGDTRHDLDPPAISQRPIGVPYEVLKFAPKKVQGDGVPMDQSGGATPPAISQRPIGVPYEVLKFAPKKVRGDGVPMDQSGGAIVDMLQSAGDQLRAAEDRINQLETEIERARAARAESWLELAERESDEKLVEPATAARSKIDDLGSAGCKGEQIPKSDKKDTTER
jgi:hypothetical protein